MQNDKSYKVQNAIQQSFGKGSNLIFSKAYNFQIERYLIDKKDLPMYDKKKEKTKAVKKIVAL